MSRWGFSIPSIALQKVLYETFVYDLESCWISCCHNKILSRFYLAFWWAYFLFILRFQVVCYLVIIFLHSHTDQGQPSTSGFHQDVRAARKKRELQQGCQSTDHQTWDSVEGVEWRPSFSLQNYPRWTDMPTIWSCFGGLCWTAPGVHSSVCFLSSPERTQSVPYLQIYSVFSIAVSFVWTLGCQFVWVLSALLFRLICSGSSWKFCERIKTVKRDLPGPTPFPLSVTVSVCFSLCVHNILVWCRLYNCLARYMVFGTACEQHLKT